MKKLFSLTIAVLMLTAFSAKADLEFSGNAYVIMGFQYNNDETGPNAHGTGIFDSNFANPNAAAPIADEAYFGFGVESIELDGNYTFGENVRIRFDLDFFDETNNGGGTTGLEQGYVTFGIPSGNTFEVAIGKMNATAGLESVDRVDNRFVTYTNAWTYLSPKNVIGAKVYYAFNENWNMDFSLLNDFNGYNITNDSTSAAPSALLRFGGNWGDMDKPSSFNLALGVGFEHSTAAGQNTTGFTGENDEDGLEYFANLWGEYVFNYFTLGYEGVARGTSPVDGGANNNADSDIHWAFGGQIYGVYEISDMTSIQARYAMYIETELSGDGSSATGTFWNGVYPTSTTGNGFEGMTHQGTLGLTHSIVDGADVTFEYNFSYADSDTADLQSMQHTGVVAFGYTF